MINIKSGEDMKKWSRAFAVACNTPASLQKFFRLIEDGHGEKVVNDVHDLIERARDEGRIRSEVEF